MSQGWTLVTGAEGFIGSHLVEHAVRAGARVRALVQYNSFGHVGWLQDLPPEVLSAVQVVSGDIRNAWTCFDVMHDVSQVFNLAALIGIPYSYRAPFDYVDTNVIGTVNLLESARRREVAAFTQISTSEVYGTPEIVPIAESHPLKAQSPYSATKIAADQLALSFFRTFGLNVRVARPFNAYGPRQSTRAFIPTVIRQGFLGRDPIVLGSLEPRRDYTFVTDTAAGIWAVGHAPGASGMIVNIGTGVARSMKSVAAEILQMMGNSAEIVEDKSLFRPPASEVEELQADSSLAQAIAGWTPDYGGEDGFRGGLTKTIDWFVANPRRLQVDFSDRRD